MRPRHLVILLALTGLGAVPYPGTQVPDRPDRVVVFIGDGVGVSYWTAARFAAGRLSVDRFRVMGLVDTRSSDSWITDSAASATAYAAGVRTYNGAIGVGPDSVPVPTVLEAARERGWATGLVATSSVTHATPAAFATHVVSRARQFDIAAQLAASGVDVLLGGGTRWFAGGTRPDGDDVLGALGRSHALVGTAEELRAVDLGSTTRLAGFFAADGMPPASERAPTLLEMTRAALEVLDHDPDGLFLMVEGSQPDWRGHDNQALEVVVGEMLDFDAAIGAALDYQDRNPGTLVLVVSDHETGGLALELAPAHARAPGDAPRPWADYTTTGHTAQMIPLFARGPGAEAFGGIRDNDEVGRILMGLVRR